MPLHPDVVLLEKGLYSAAQLGTKTSGATGIGLAQVTRIVLDRMAFAPHEAQALVFIVRNAEELTTRAANAILKTLEEPPGGVYFVLLTSRPERLLDTIRSRTLPVRFGPLPDSTLRKILSEKGLSVPDDALSLAAGSAGTAIQLADADTERGRSEFIQQISACTAAADLGQALQFASALRPDRADLKRNLLALSQHYALGVRRHVSHRAQFARQLAQHYEDSQAALEHLDQNTPPTLVLETLIARLRRASR